MASDLGLYCLFIGFSIINRIQSNLGDSNANFSKPPNFSNLTVSPDHFAFILRKKYCRFSNFDYSKNSVFLIKLSVPIKEIPSKSISKFEVKICQTQLRMITFSFEQETSIVTHPTDFIRDQQKKGLRSRTVKLRYFTV